MNAGESRTVLKAAGLTDTGKVRSNNQDQFMLSTDAQLWVVADGMGGHKGGEIASDLACQEMARSYLDHTVNGLSEAVVAANRSVHDAGEADPNLRGMGTTMVALAVVRVTPDDLDQVQIDLPDAGPDDEVLAIANVGDSRAYRLAQGELQQVTADHSLVAEMVRDGNLAPEEAETHPQKNILTRVLGPYGDVSVDVVSIRPQVGDRYLLCSDGLFNEVSVPEIAAVLRRLSDPADAADELVRMALANGARDNTTVVIADVVNDPDDPGVATGNRPVGAYSDPGDPGRSAHAHIDTAEIPAGVPTSRNGNGPDDGPETSSRHSRRARHKGADQGPKPRRFTWRVAAFLVVLLALIGGAVYTVQWWATSAYYVGLEGDQVAVYQGRPGGVLVFQPELVSDTPLTRDDVPVENLASVEDGQEYDTLDEAEEFVQELTDRATVYLVGLDDNDVVILLQVPGADPEVVERSELTRSDLPSERQEQITEGDQSYDALDEAQSYLDQVEREVNRQNDEADQGDGASGDGNDAENTDENQDGGEPEDPADAGDQAAPAGDDGGVQPDS